MPKLERELMIKEFKQKINKKNYLFLTNHTGLSSNEFNALRKKLYNARVDYFVVKNTLSRRALKDVKMEGLADLIDGPTSVAFTDEDPSIASKLLVDFAKDHAALKIRGGFLKGEILDINKVKELASLPARDVLLAQVFGTLNAPVNGFVNVLAAVLRNFVTVVKKISEQKEKGN